MTSTDGVVTQERLTEFAVKYPYARGSRYELRINDERCGLSKGDILICESMHWAWADEKVAVCWRESDGYEPGCSQYRAHIRHVSGPRS